MTSRRSDGIRRGQLADLRQQAHDVGDLPLLLDLPHARTGARSSRPCSARSAPRGSRLPRAHARDRRAPSPSPRWRSRALRRAAGLLAAGPPSAPIISPRPAISQAKRARAMGGVSPSDLSATSARGVRDRPRPGDRCARISARGLELAQAPIEFDETRSSLSSSSDVVLPQPPSKPRPSPPHISPIAGRAETAVAVAKNRLGQLPSRSDERCGEARPRSSPPSTRGSVAACRSSHGRAATPAPVGVQLPGC